MGSPPHLPLPAGTMLKEFNLFAFNQSILDNAAALGFTNTTDPCYDFKGLPTDANSVTGCTSDNINTFCTGTTFIQPPRCRPSGPKVSGGGSGTLDLGDAAHRLRRLGLCGLSSRRPGSRGGVRRADQRFGRRKAAFGRPFRSRVSPDRFLKHFGTCLPRPNDPLPAGERLGGRGLRYPRRTPAALLPLTTLKCFQ